MYSELIRKIKCRICGEEKEVTAFSPRKNRPCGYESRCKPCNTKRSLKYHYKNRNELLPKMRKRAVCRYKEDPSIAKFYGRTGKKKIRQATPKWADLEAIKLFYLVCPKGMTVDHIIPLKGKNVSGLHVLENLQYLTARENSKKHNKFLG